MTQESAREQEFYWKAEDRERLLGGGPSQRVGKATLCTPMGVPCRWPVDQGRLALLLEAFAGPPTHESTTI